jgi:hypothetical protein
MLLFRSEAHVDHWTVQWGLPRGALLTPAQAWALARAWYGEDRRAPGWRRRAPADAQALLTGLGLTGPFWQLTAA